MLGKVGRNTRQRNLILIELKKLASHPTPEELYEVVKLKMPEIGISTVYRNLEKFAKEGLIEKIHGKFIRYDGNIQPHNHIKCVCCGKVEDVNLNLDCSNFQESILNYKLKDLLIELNGVCPNCQKKKEEVNEQ